MRRALIAGSAVGLALAAAPLAVSAQTAITPDVGGRGLGTTTSAAGHVTTIDGGTLAGGNLFHSFAAFSLGAGDTAQWVRTGGDPAAVRNVVNRVTGGQPSQIAGSIDSTALPNAAFFFINPAGIVFGAGAQVNVPAAAYFSTASQLRFADGSAFSVATPGGSTLSMAAPQSFGFVGGEGGIAVQAVDATFAKPAEAITLVGADVNVTGSHFVARGLDLIGAGTAAITVDLDDPLAARLGGAVTVQGVQLAISTDSGARGVLRLGGGAVTLDGGQIASDSANAVPGGDIALAGGQVTLRNGVTLGAATRGAAPGGSVTVTAGDLRADGGLVYTTTLAAGAAGRLSFTADTMTLSGAISISSSASADGAAGPVSLSARTSMEADDAIVTNSALGSGDGGDITIAAPHLQLIDALAVTTGSAEGKPGNVRISGDDILSSGGVLGSSPGAKSDTGDLFITATTRYEGDATIMTASTYSDGSAGIISIAAPQIELNGGFIDANSYGAGGVGRVSIAGQTLALTDTQITSESQGAFTDQVGMIQLKGTTSVSMSGGSISSNANLFARGGAISIEGGKVTLDNPKITADSLGFNDGGSVSIRGSSVHISNGAISSDAVNEGAAGDVTIQAPVIVLDQAAKISSDALNKGDAGDVTLIGGAIKVLDGASVSSQATGGTGAAGAVTVTGDSLLVQDSSISSDTKGQGNAGAVTVNVGSIELDGLGRETSTTFISSVSQGDGDAGTVTIKAGSLFVHDSAFIASDTGGIGHAGDVSITADTFTLRGGDGDITYVSSDSLPGAEGDAGSVTITAKALKIDQGAFISSDTYTAGAAGTVKIAASTSLALDNQGAIRSATFSDGEAGDVEVTAGAVTLDHQAAISSEAFEQTTGNAGFVSLTATSVKVSGDARISTSSAGIGSAGEVTLKTGTLDLDGGDISSAALPGAAGRSGALTIDADAISLTAGGTISTISNNGQRAGVIDVTAGSISVAGAGAFITSENRATGAGDAGSVFLAADKITVADGGRISTNSVAGAAGDVEISIQRPGLLILQGATSPGVIQTSSGPGTGGKITISNPLAIISNGGSLQALGQLRGANVVIQSRYFINSTDRVNTVDVAGDLHLETGLYDVSSGTVSRDLSVLDASKVLRGQCPAARSTGVVSQLVSRPVGPYVREAAPAAVQPPAAPRPCQ